MDMLADRTAGSMSLLEVSNQTGGSKSVVLPDGTAGLVVGAGGRTITKIREITDCCITLHEGAQTTAQIEGPDKASRQAQDSPKTCPRQAQGGPGTTPRQAQDRPTHA